MVQDNSDNNIQDNIIRGKALYFSTSQVATMLDQPDSKIRYYTNVFDDILHIEVSNKQRRYKEADIDKLRFLIELKNEGMTIKQIQEYCQEVDFDNTKEIQIKENNPLSIQTLAKALLEQQAILIEEMKKDIIESLRDEIINNNDVIKEELCLTVDQVISEKNDFLKDEMVSMVESKFKESIENQSKQLQDNFNNMSEKIIEENRKELEDLKNEIKYVSQEEINKYQEKNKGWFSKIFNKK